MKTKSEATLTTSTESKLEAENEKLKSLLAEARKELEEVVQTRDEFITIVSHELKTPLTTLLLTAQLQQRMLKNKDPKALEESRIRRLVDQTEIQTIKLNVLVEDMLDITRIKSGKLNFKKANTDLVKVIRDLIVKMESQFTLAGYAVPSLLGTKAFAVFDPVRIEQVVSNLLINAIKYGSGLPITIKLEDLENLIRVSIEDGGTGISKIDQSRIFNRFERAISANEISGLGLGLFISKQIIESHFGKIWVNSEKGNGSIFKFELPKGLE